MPDRLKVPDKLKLPADPPPFWPRFRSPLRSTALTARVGRVVGICFGICFVTGMLSHYQYQPWSWLPEPVSPKWLYRITQGLHVATGTITIPLLLVKLWSVYPKLFQWPFVKSPKQAVERLSIGLLVGSAFVELFSGLFNAMDWYLFPWSFTAVHRFLAYVVIGSILLHIAIKLPDIKYGLSTPLDKGDVLTEIPWEDNPHAFSNNENTHVDPPTPTGISRRGVLVATGAGVGLFAATNVGQSFTPLRPVNLFAIREPGKGDLGVPVNRLASAARVTTKLVSAANYSLQVKGGTNDFAMSIDEIEAMVAKDGHGTDLPLACVEGWSVQVHWRGIRLIDLVTRAGGNADSRVFLDSLEGGGSYRSSYLEGSQVAGAMLATHLNGKRLDLNHGYPIRLIAPNRPGVLNTKWLKSVEIV